MGGSESKTNATLDSNTTVINESTLNQFNSLVNKTAVNTMIENVKKCSASVVQSQHLTIKNITCGDNCNIALAQDQSAWLDFNCAQKDDVQMDVIQKMIDNINTTLKDNTSTDLLNKLNSNISSKSQSDWGALPWGGSSSNANVNQSIKNYVSNKTNVNTSNAIENAVYASFKNSNINECIAKIISEQEIKATDISAGKNFTFTVNQSQKADAIASCIQNANIASRVITDVTKFAGLDLSIKKDTEVENISETKAESESKNTGFFQGIGSVVESVGTAIGNVFGGLLSGLGLGAFAPLLGPSRSSSLCCCCCIIILIILMVIFGGGMSFLTGSSTESSTGNTNEIEA